MSTTPDTMRLMKSIWFDEKAQALADAEGWSFLQARRFLKDRELIERRSGKDRRSSIRGEDRRSNGCGGGI